MGDLSKADVATRESATFGSSGMQLAARVFRHLTVSPADAARDARLAGYSGDAPVLLVLTPDATKGFSLQGTELTAAGALEKMKTVTASVSTDDLASIVAAAERTQASIAVVDEELRTLSRTPMTAADRQDRVAAATARRDTLVVEFRAHFTLHARPPAHP